MFIPHIQATREQQYKDQHSYIQTKVILNEHDLIAAINTNYPYTRLKTSCLVGLYQTSY